MWKFSRGGRGALRGAACLAAVLALSAGAWAQTAAPPEQQQSETAVQTKDVEELPQEGNRWGALEMLAPEANDGGAAGGGGAVAASFDGLDPLENRRTVDGVSDEQSYGSGGRGIAGGGGSRAEYTFSAGSVQELRLSVHRFSAEVGNGAGGSIHVNTRSGTNRLHGSAEYLMRTSVLAAADSLAVASHYNGGAVTSEIVKPHDLRQQVRGALGGALRRDRLFYFYAWDGMHRGFPAVSAPAYPEFYALTTTQRALLANRGVSDAQTDAALRYIDGLTGNVDRSARQTVNFGKLDWVRRREEHWSVDYNRARWSSPRGSRSGAVEPRGRSSFADGKVEVDAAVGRWSREWKRMSEDLRVQVSRDFEYDAAQTPLAQEPAIGPGGFAPEVRIGDVGSGTGFLFGTPATAARRAYPDERRVQVVDALTVEHGRQQWVAGFDWSRVQDRIDTLNNAEGTFSYDSGATGGRAGGLVDWITDYTYDVHAYPNGGCPSIYAATHNFCFRSFTQSFGGEAVEFNVQQWAAYVQDTWRVKPGLTVNAGVRWEYELLPLPQQVNADLDAVFLERGATSVFPEDRNNFGPRVGVAWAPGERWGGRVVVRGGYGVFFGRLPGTLVRSGLMDTALPDTTTQVRITPSTVTQCPQVATSQGFGYPCAYVAAPPQAVGRTTRATVFGRRFRLPVVQRGEVSVERPLGAGASVRARYVLNRTVQLPSSVDLNVAPATGTEEFVLRGSDGRGVRDGETFVAPVYTERVTEEFGPVTAIVSDSNATYNAAVVESEWRGHRLNVRGSWTWSKAIDYGEIRAGGVQTNNQFDPFNTRYDRGLSALNYPHKVLVSAIWEPRFAWSGMSAWADRSVNGWTLSGIMNESSGRPYSYRILGGRRLSGGRESINGSGGATFLPTVGRDTLRMPDTATVNLRVSRRFALGGRVTARVFAQGFNVLNRRNLSGVTERAFLVGAAVAGQPTPLVFQDAATVAAEGLSTRPFGAPTEISTSLRRERQVELGLRVEF